MRYTLAIVALSVGCSSDPDPAPVTTNVIGTVCTSNEACAGGFCATDTSTCSKACSAHTDCGCPSGTTNADLIQGKCASACVKVDGDGSRCVKTCASGACATTALVCKSKNADDFDLGFSYCAKP